MQAHIDIVLRTLVAMIMLLLIAKILGKQTISSLTFLDFVTGIILGSLAANLAFNKDLKSSYMIVALIVIAATSFLLSVIAIKSRRMRSWISGSPTVLIENGKILDGNMKKVRYSLDSLDQALREKEIFNLEVVEYAVLEDNGMVSVLKKQEYQFVTRKDLKLPSVSQSFPVELIMDGVLIVENLENNDLTKEWLEKQLSRKGKRISDVFYGVRGTQQQLVFDYYEDGIREPIDKE
ncbi:hypothetical protein D3C76_527640 [compost metagenome]